MNKPIEYVLLNNNSILIGKISFEDDIIDVEDPYLVQSTGSEVIIIPFLESVLKQEVKNFRTNVRNVLSTIPVEKNDILDTYIKTTSKIETPEYNIII